ncbi:eukaryotic initiation factor [Musa troglodytarum]|uniref:Eukaryotic initiation factor n=1 Tax=Musa troglodytarum TaxID=320322 RepID=A0A9E7HQ44_9LILI|nr:eukaryotic initiation factor [Musa troglodytarum]
MGTVADRTQFDVHQFDANPDELLWFLHQPEYFLCRLRRSRGHLVGGNTVHEGQRILSSGVHHVVGTPGRVFDMLRGKAIHAEHIKLFVLDEADEMLASGYQNQVKKVFQLLPFKIQVGLSLEMVVRFTYNP